MTRANTPPTHPHYVNFAPPPHPLSPAHPPSYRISASLWFGCVNFWGGGEGGERGVKGKGSHGVSGGFLAFGFGGAGGLAKGSV
jgi:hypothetical protein